MTPRRVAEFLAGQFSILPRAIRLLDAGAGVGALTAAFVREACGRRPKPQSIFVAAYEIEPRLNEPLQDTLQKCGVECGTAGIDFSWEIFEQDYIESATLPLLVGSRALASYNCAILNPPYAKIKSNSNARQALRRVGVETSNLYSAFVALALDQLERGGQLVAITPRSFCNGPYFAPFRKWMLERAALNSIHVYDSRTETFNDDAVLQENVVFHLSRSERQPPYVTVTSSEGPTRTPLEQRRTPFSEIVRPNDPHQFIRLVTSKDGEELAQRIRSLPCTLNDVGIQVSTGRVVDFRAREHLRAAPGSDTVPLIYPCHFEDGYVAWPLTKSRKPNALVRGEKTARLLVLSGTYVLTKRFTSKEERRRIVAAVFDPDRVQCTHVGFENHLNYFHTDGHGLDPGAAIGLAVFLNSTAVDQFFRLFSGHTQVNATDLRALHYPTIEQLRELGLIVGDRVRNQEEVDRIVEPFL